MVTPGGNRYFVTFKDDFSSYCTTKLLKKKSEVAVALQNFVATVKNQKREGVRCIRTDNGGEYLSGELQGWLNKEGIKHEKSTQQNGVAERTNRTLMEAARSMLYGKKVPLELWGEAIMCATHIQIRKISSSNDMTPFELWNGTKPDVSY